MEILYANDGDRHVKVQGRISDKSGHSLILDMLEDLPTWNQQTLTITAYSLMADIWRAEKDQGRELAPLQPSQAVVTKEMRELQRQSTELLQMTKKILEQMLNGVYLNKTGISQELTEDILAKIEQIDIITTASDAFGGDLIENQEDVDENW